MPKEKIKYELYVKETGQVFQNKHFKEGSLKEVMGEEQYQKILKAGYRPLICDTAAEAKIKVAEYKARYAEYLNRPLSEKEMKIIQMKDTPENVKAALNSGNNNIARQYIQEFFDRRNKEAVCEVFVNRNGVPQEPQNPGYWRNKMTPKEYFEEMQAGGRVHQFDKLEKAKEYVERCNSILRRPLSENEQKAVEKFAPAEIKESMKNGNNTDVRIWLKESYQDIQKEQSEKRNTMPLTDKEKIFVEKHHTPEIKQAMEQGQYGKVRDFIKETSEKIDTYLRKEPLSHDQLRLIHTKAPQEIKDAVDKGDVYAGRMWIKERAEFIDKLNKTPLTEKQMEMIKTFSKPEIYEAVKNGDIRTGRMFLNTFSKEIKAEVEKYSNRYPNLNHEIKADLEKAELTIRKYGYENLRSSVYHQVAHNALEPKNIINFLKENNLTKDATPQKNNDRSR